MPPEDVEEPNNWLSPTSHAKRGWRVDEGRRLLDARGTTVIRAEEYRALNLIAASLPKG